MHAYRYYPARMSKGRGEARARDRLSARCRSAHEGLRPLIKAGRPPATPTVVDAYLSPILGRLRRASGQPARRQEFPGARLMFMIVLPAGLTARRAVSRAKDAILSGPVGAGVVGNGGKTGREAGFNRLIGFDMGRATLDRTCPHFRRRVPRGRGVRNRGPRGVRMARADDADPHGRGRRRLDPATLMGPRFPRRTRQARRAPNPRTEMLSPAAARSPSPTPT